MRRALGPLLLVGMAIGCQSTSPATDPFMRARVPPPSTGVIGPPPGAGYGTAVAPPGVAPPGVTMPPPPPIAPPPGTPYDPPGNAYQYNAAPPQSGPPGMMPSASNAYNSNVPVQGRAVSPAPVAMPASGTPSSPIQGLAPPPATKPNSFTPPPTQQVPREESMYNREGKVGRIQPMSVATASAAGRLSYAAEADPDGVQTMPGEQSSIPPKKFEGVPTARPLSDPHDMTGVEPVSFIVPATSPGQAAHSTYDRQQQPDSGDAAEAEEPAVATPADNEVIKRRATSGNGPSDHGATYGFDGNYAWLHGQLEYSAATRQWKLRYIPIDGPTDRYGGSVVLADTEGLRGYKPGDFVSIKGQLDGRSGPQGTYAPFYRVTQVERLSD